MPPSRKEFAQTGALENGVHGRCGGSVKPKSWGKTCRSVPNLEFSCPCPSVSSLHLKLICVSGSVSILMCLVPDTALASSARLHKAKDQLSDPQAARPVMVAAARHSPSDLGLPALTAARSGSQAPELSISTSFQDMFQPPQSEPGSETQHVGCLITSVKTKQPSRKEEKKMCQDYATFGQGALLHGLK